MQIMRAALLCNLYANSNTVYGSSLIDCQQGSALPYIPSNSSRRLVEALQASVSPVHFFLWDAVLLINSPLEPNRTMIEEFLYGDFNPLEKILVKLDHFPKYG